MSKSNVLTTSRFLPPTTLTSSRVCTPAPVLPRTPYSRSRKASPLENRPLQRSSITTGQVRQFPSSLPHSTPQVTALADDSTDRRFSSTSKKVPGLDQSVIECWGLGFGDQPQSRLVWNSCGNWSWSRSRSLVLPSGGSCRNSKITPLDPPLTFLGGQIGLCL